MKDTTKSWLVVGGIVGLGLAAVVWQAYDDAKYDKETEDLLDGAKTLVVMAHPPLWAGLCRKDYTDGVQKAMEKNGVQVSQRDVEDPRSMAYKKGIRVIQLFNDTDFMTERKETEFGTKVILRTVVGERVELTTNDMVYVPKDGLYKVR